jgi:hypothetical protein
MALSAAQITNVYQALYGRNPTTAELIAVGQVDAQFGDQAAINSVINTQETTQFDNAVFLIIKGATGVAPTAAQLKAWANFLETTTALLVSQGVNPVAAFVQAETQMTNAFSNNPLFQGLYGVSGTAVIQNNAAGQTFVNAVITNTQGHPASAAQLAAWASGQYTAAQIFAQFATNDAAVTANQAAIAAFLLNAADTAAGITPTTILQTLSLTLGQDTAITGQAFDGTGPIVLGGNVVINAPLAVNAFGTQLPTLSNFDMVQLSGLGNALNAFFDAGAGFFAQTVTGATLQGLQSATFSNATFGPGAGLININGSANLFGPTAGATNGLLHLTLANSGRTTLNVGGTNGAGGAGTGIQSLLQDVNLINDATGSTVSAFINGALFPATSSVIVSVKNTAGGTDTVNVGPDTGATGYTTFNLSSAGGGAGFVNTISLGAMGATNAKTLNLADDGAFTFLFASTSAGSGVGNWGGLTAINGVGANGGWFISGAEGPNGFLAAKTVGPLAISLGNGVNTVDLTSYTSSAANLNIALGTSGGNTLHLNSTLADTTTAFAGFSGVNTLFDAATAGGVLAGIVNMAMFPGVTALGLEDANGGGAPALSNDLVVNNAAATFAVHLQSVNFNAHNFGLVGVGGAASTATLDYVGPTGGSGIFSVQNYAHTVIQSDVGGNNVALGGTQFVAAAPLGSNELLTIQLLNNDVLTLGNNAVTPATVGHDTVTLLGGSLFGPTPGNIVQTGDVTTILNLGVTNALSINVSGHLFMNGPDDSFTYAGANHVGDAVFAGGTNSILQGTMGPLTAVLVNGQNGWTGATSGPNALATQDILQDLAGATNGNVAQFFGDGGGDLINIGQNLQTGNGHTLIDFGLFDAGGALHNQVITDNTDAAYTGFWNQGAAGTVGGPTVLGAFSTSADITTINGFSLAGTSDIVQFNASSWAGGVAGKGALVNGDGTEATNGFAVQQLVTAPGTLINAATNVVDYGIDGGLADAAGLANALSNASGNGAVLMTGPILAGEHMLFAYNSGGTVKIADVDFISGVGAGLTTAGTTIVASDMVSFGTSTVSLLGISTHADIVLAHVLA